MPSDVITVINPDSSFFGMTGIESEQSKSEYEGWVYITFPPFFETPIPFMEHEVQRGVR